MRGPGVAAKTFGGSVTELDKVTREAAEYVMKKSRPNRWATYLSRMGRYAEAIEFCRTTIAGVVNPAERAALFDAWATSTQVTGGSITESVELYREAVKLKPDMWVSRSNIQNALIVLGDEEGAWRAGEEMRTAAGGRPGKAPDQFYQNWDYLTWNLQAWLAGQIADAATNGGYGTSSTGAAGLVLADIHARLHDATASELALKTTKEDPRDPSYAAIAHFVRGRLAMESGERAKAAEEMEAFGKAYANPVVATNDAGYNCWIAPAEEAAGRPDRADAVLASAGGPFVDCLRFRADILDGRGQWAEAQQAYAAAVALAPDLPAAYYSWGVALAKHADPGNAQEKLKDANLRGPHWADPLKAWGDVLAWQGRAKEALGKYDEALKYAPNWKELRQAREALAKEKV